MSCLGRMLPQTIRMDGSRPPNPGEKLVTNNYNPTFAGTDYTDCGLNSFMDLVPKSIEIVKE